MRRLAIFAMLVFLSMACASVDSAEAPYVELKVEQATLLREGAPAEMSPAPDRFGPGLSSVDLVGSPLVKTRLRWTLPSLPPGDYYIGLLLLAQGYLHFSEFFPGQIELYHNDQRVHWASHSEPRKPENAAEQSRYQAEMRAGPVRLRAGDALDVVYVHPWGSITVGPLRLYRTKPSGSEVALPLLPHWGKPRDTWLFADWGETQRDGGVIRQKWWMINPGAKPRKVTVEALAKSFTQVELLSKKETLQLGPGERIEATYEFPAGQDAVRRLTIEISSEGAWPPVRLVKYYVDDVMEGPRPRTCLNGEWEMCYVAGPHPGEKPPADAQWARINVPSLQPNDKGHCAWYRKVFQAPPYIRGERIILRCEQVLTEAWFYLNGQQVGYQKHGSRPFEVDITSAFRPGETNELLVAVRDWIAYSPKNQERVAAGEDPIYKDRMEDIVGYTGAANLGVGGPVWLEARPAVSVEDVFIVTSVRQKKLLLKYRLQNAGPEDQEVTLSAQVLDAGKPVKKVGEARVKVAASGTAEVTLEAPWSNPKLWWPDDPHLYVLQTDLRPARGDPDRRLDRFGFREFWIDGISFVLNGTRVKIRSQWSGGAVGTYQAEPYWQEDKRLEAIWAWQVRNVRDADVQLTRTHNMPGVFEAADVADETGLMLKIESEFSQVNFTFDQVFWKAGLEHELRVMDAYKNHPSVVMWSAGNENMWGWIYQGEAAKVLGNRWQVKIVKAMREFDLMRRPIEWEADGDLMGAWEHYALHYPRELAGNPALPVSAWWGPLDGKTVVPYSMGPIILGSKPLTVGEAFWPATLNRPYAVSIILGDDAYLGGAYYAKGWLESSQYFINGFRDVEFALIDVYVPLYMIKPQTVVVKEEDRAFYGGGEVVRNVNVHNDVLREATLTLRWSLTADKPLASGQMQMKLKPAELKRLTLRIPLPKVSKDTAARLRIELWEGKQLLHAEERGWRISPPLTIKPPAGLSLAVYDPAGTTAALLQKLKVPFTRLTALEAPRDRALIIGVDGLKEEPPGPWREALSAWVRDGGKLVILAQSEPPDFLPVPLTQARPTTGAKDLPKCTMAFVRASDHPILDGLTDWDLRWWAPDHFVSAGNFRKPTQGNWLPLVDAGTGDGLVETPLLEEYEGRGSYVLCQMPIVEKAERAPAAGRLLSNLLNYLASSSVYRVPGATALLAGPSSGLRKMLDEAKVVYEDVTASPSRLTRDRFSVALVDAASALTEESVAPLRAFAEAGGRVMVYRLAPPQQSAAERLAGVRLRLLPMEKEPTDVQQQVWRGPNVGLMAGISNHDLFWPSNTYLADLRHEGCWWSGHYPGFPPEELMADYLCEPGDDALALSQRLTHPCLLLQVPVGKGFVVVSNFRLDAPIPEVAVTAARLRSLLLTNLGCELRGEGGAARARRERLAQYEYFTVDLGPFATRGFRDDPQAGIVGWTNQGENDMRALPTGRQVFSDVPFYIAAPKGAVVLYSVSGENKDLPKQVTGIPIGRRADVLFFLHTAAWCNETPFKYRVNYEDGTSEEIIIREGQHVLDWWADPLRYAEALGKHGMFIAWQGDNPMRKGVILPGFEWRNPHPEKVIRDLDFLTIEETGYTAVPVLVAITGAVSRPREGVVVDVIGTAGVRVRLGTTEEDIYYIGTVGIPQEHPYYEKAVEAHRRLVVGQKVQIVDDVMTRNSAGQRVAYVYFQGDIYSLANLVNARIIGDGLGKLGNFEGNNRHRMYLENLGFIAQQKRVGMWAEGDGR